MTPASSVPSTRPRTLKDEVFPGLLLAAAAMLPFALVSPREFTNWDDRSNIVENGSVRHLTTTNVAWMFTHEIGANYVPLTWLSHALDWIVWGDWAWGHGFTNALLHACCCLLLVACLRRGGLAVTWAFIAGLLFAVHPIHAENVAWLSGRKDLLCSAALFACQLAYMGWRVDGRRSSWCWSLFWLIAAGLSKPMAMSAVVPLWLYDALWIGPSDVDKSNGWRSRLAMKRACLSLLPHAVVCGAIAVISVFAQRSGTAIAGARDHRWGSIDLIGCNLAYQLFRCWIPFPFSPFLPSSVLEAIPRALRWLATAGLGGATIIVTLRATTGPVSKGLAWWWWGALAFLLPVCGVVPLGHTSLADRYLYIPSIGPCIFVALGMAALARHAALLARGVAIASVVGLGLLTYQRARAWSDSVSLWRTVLEVYPHCDVAWRNLTRAYFQAQQLGEAAEVSVQALAEAPGDVRVFYNAAARLLDIGDFAQAEKVLADADARFPNAAEVLVQRGGMALRRGKPGEAAEYYVQASKSRPKWDDPYLDLTYALDQADDLPGAIAAARKAIEIAPKSPGGRSRLIDLLLKARRPEEAAAELATFTAVCPHFADGWKARITLLRSNGRLAEADEIEREATRYVAPDRLK